MSEVTFKPFQRVLVRDTKPRNNLTGHRYGRLLVLGEPKKSLTNRMVSYLCQCDCGKIIRIIGSKLTSGHTTSCGCFHKEQLSQRNKTHGMSKTRLYRIWKRMKQRCYDKNVKEYHRYGGRGINVCEQWTKDFLPFFEWAYANGYEENLTIDRIDNSKGYYPENCRWATRKMQAQNRG